MKSTTQPQLKELLQFPCEFKIKIMGINTPELISEVAAIVGSLASNFEAQRDITSKLSSKGNYLAVTATIIATSKQQLDSIYLALNQHSLVKITL